MSLAVATGWVAGGPPSGVLARYHSRFAVAGIDVAIHADKAELVALGPQLAGFAGNSRLSADTDAEIDPDIDLEIEWTAKIEPARSRQLFHSGCLWNVHEHGDGLLF